MRCGPVIALTAEQALCQGFIRCINDRNFKDLDNFLHDDVMLDYPGVAPIRKKRMVIMFFRQLRAKFTTLDFEIRRVLQTGSALAVEWENAGTRKEGQVYSNQGVSIIEVSEKKIVLINDYFKEHGNLK